MLHQRAAGERTPAGLAADALRSEGSARGPHAALLDIPPAAVSHGRRRQLPGGRTFVNARSDAAKQSRTCGNRVRSSAGDSFVAAFPTRNMRSRHSPCGVSARIGYNTDGCRRVRLPPSKRAAVLCCSHRRFNWGGSADRFVRHVQEKQNALHVVMTSDLQVRAWYGSAASALCTERQGLRPLDVLCRFPINRCWQR